MNLFHSSETKFIYGIEDTTCADMNQIRKVTTKTTEGHPDIIELHRILPDGIWIDTYTYTLWNDPNDIVEYYNDYCDVYYEITLSTSTKVIIQQIRPEP